MRKLIIVFYAVILSSACKKSEYATSIPACIKSDIEENKGNPYWQIQNIEEYEYQGELVYIYNSDNVIADAEYPVLKADCTVLCSLGGFFGTIMCNGEKFSEKATFRRKVWQK